MKILFLGYLKLYLGRTMVQWFTSQNEGCGFAGLLESFCVEFTSSPCACFLPQSKDMNGRFTGGSELAVDVSVSCLFVFILKQTDDLSSVYASSHPMWAGIGSSPGDLLQGKAGQADGWMDIVSHCIYHAVIVCNNKLARKAKHRMGFFHIM